MEPSAEARARKRGRRVGWAVYGLLMTAFAVTSAVEIIDQAFSTPTDGATVDCDEGVSGLVAAVSRARLGAASESGGERAALERFRAALQPEWEHRAAVGAACAGHPVAERLLRELDLLRYAEEATVRYETVELARRRRNVAALEQELGNGAP